MSLGKMLTKMAIGFAVAKGMQQVSKSGGIGKVMEGLTGAGGTTQAGAGGGGLSDIMGQLGGGAQGGASGGLGGLLGGLAGGQAAGSTGGGLGDLLGGLTGGAGGGTADAAAGGLGGLGGLLGGLATARGGNGGGLEALLSGGNPVEEPEPEDTAGLMIRAMVMAANSDGELDAAEQKQLMTTLGKDAGETEIAFVREAMQAPVDPAAIAADTPKGLETQVYSMSVMSMTPANAQEAHFLHQLAQALTLTPQTVNEIHDNFGVPHRYS